jgi:hypothetical protein
MGWVYSKKTAASHGNGAQYAKGGFFVLQILERKGGFHIKPYTHYYSMAPNNTQFIHARVEILGSVLRCVAQMMWSLDAAKLRCEAKLNTLDTLKSYRPIPFWNAIK